MSTVKADQTELYILGDSEDELKRLKEQDADVNEHTVDVISRLDIKPGSRILDLACGPGFVSINHLSKLVGENGCVVALDALEKWIQHINSFKIENIKTICSTVQNANFQENEFDAIFCRYGLWIFKDVVSVLARIRKWLKPGGKFGMIAIIFTPRLHYPPIPGPNEIYEAATKLVELSGGNPWIGAQLPRLLTEAGFQIKYESPFILHGGPESSFFKQFTTGESINRVHSKLIESGLLSKETLDAYWRGIDEMKANPYSRMFDLISVKIVTVK